MVMRIVAVSDTHRNLDFPIPEGDVFIHAGDIGNFETGKDPSAYYDFLEMLNDLPHKHKLIIAGNHDKYLENNEEEFLKSAKIWGITYLRDDFEVIDGIHFYGSPWTKYINSRHAFGEPYNKIKSKWNLILDKTDILITHQAPFQILSTAINGSELGCRELQKRVFDIKPIAHIFGHIHASSGTKQMGNTLFCNVSYDKVYNNKCLVLDLDPDTKEIEIIQTEEEW